MSDAEPSKPTESKNRAYIPGDDSSTRWRNTINLLLGRLSDEGVAQYKKGRDDRYEKEDCERCEKHRDYMLKYSKIYVAAFNDLKD
jgi:inner membrane protease ATP23